ncbi:unnamed protein product [Nyctereutes procyonoides]|uniref:(raccoon dog) hypothetical protein n=1 Tax=Nyctereutes procyonoides TaxID=34880 RepID=A0A811XWN1_NYCPR|nr:unnamed protein product [Nyctereutes procyonoides]
MKGNREMVYDCPSSSFDGIIVMMSPEDHFKSNMYGVSVTGRLPQGIMQELYS